jgi:hypothetical protein
MTSVFKFKELRFTSLKVLTVLNNFISSFRTEKVSVSENYCKWKVDFGVIKSVF